MSRIRHICASRRGRGRLLDLLAALAIAAVAVLLPTGAGLRMNDSAPLREPGSYAVSETAHTTATSAHVTALPLPAGLPAARR